MKLAPIVGSLAINSLMLALLGALAAHDTAPPVAEPIDVEIIDSPAPPVILPAAAGRAHAPASGGGSPARGHASRERTAPHAPEATRSLSELAVRSDEAPGLGTAGGIGGGRGGGIGDGIGFGAGGTLITSPALPGVPAPPPPSHRRAARLLHPSRQTEVDAEELFVARVTVDEAGDVVGAHMLRSQPGSRGEIADTMIWQFRYAPALDDDGTPVRSTFEQTFAVR